MRRLQTLLLLFLTLTFFPFAALAEEGGGTSTTSVVLLSPANGSSGSANPEFTWSAVDGAVSYKLDLASDPDFTTLVDSIETVATSHSLAAPLPAGETIYWRVTAFVGTGEPIPSEVWSYSVEADATSTPEPTSTIPPEPTSTDEPSLTPTSTVIVEPTSTATASPQPSATESDQTTQEPTRTPSEVVTATPEPQPVTRSELSGALGPSGYALTGVGRSSGSVHPRVLTDRDLGTIWTSPATTPGSAYVVLSIGSVQSIGEIKWVLGKTGRADQIRIAISTDRASWTEVGRFRNSAVGEWQSLKLTGRAMYVRIMLVNIRGDRWLGGLVEVEVHPPKAKPTPTATPTKTPDAPTPIADGLVRNASLEQGAASWYLEEGVRVSASRPRSGERSLAVSSAGGYADQGVSVVPGKTYELTVWGSMTRAYDVAYVGIVFRDRNGVRLPDLEPQKLEFTSTRYVRQELTFTVDSWVKSAKVYVWKLEGTAGFYVDDFRLRQTSADDDESSGDGESICQGLLVPGYFDPRTTSLWNETTATGTGVQFVIFNPNNGVGSRFDQVWADVVASSRAAGFRVLAYVQTDFGDRSTSAVIAEMDQYREWYGVEDFFLDEADTVFGSVERYRAMVGSIHRNGGIAVLNFGWMPHPAYMEFTDVAGVFEASYSLYGDAYQRPAWFYEYPPERFLHIVHSTPSSKWTEVIEKSRARNAAYVWVTDDDTVSYYKSLPSFWTRLNQTIGSGC